MYTYVYSSNNDNNDTNNKNDNNHNNDNNTDNDANHNDNDNTTMYYYDDDHSYYCCYHHYHYYYINIYIYIYIYILYTHTYIITTSIISRDIKITSADDSNGIKGYNEFNVCHPRQMLSRDNKCHNPDFLGFSCLSFSCLFKNTPKHVFLERFMGGELLFMFLFVLNERFWGCLESRAKMPLLKGTAPSSTSASSTRSALASRRPAPSPTP